MNIDILESNKDFLVINKPADLMVHGDGRSDEATLADWLLKEYPEIAGIGEDWSTDNDTLIPRPGIVHRLDRETSGVMVIAHTQEMFAHLKDAFQNRTVSKEYHALVYEWIKHDEGQIDASIGKSRKDFRMWSAGRGARGRLRDAATRYEVLSRFEDQSGNKFTHVRCFPETGRTHQIRVHLKYLNHPVVGDTLYAGKRITAGASSDTVFALGFTRHALHAYELSFPSMDDPAVKHTYTAEIPRDFQKALAHVGENSV